MSTLGKLTPGINTLPRSTTYEASETSYGMELIKIKLHVAYEEAAGPRRILLPTKVAAEDATAILSSSDDA